MHAHYNGILDEPWARQPAGGNYYAYRNYFANQFFFCDVLVRRVPTYRDRSTELLCRKKKRKENRLIYVYYEKKLYTNTIMLY